MYELNLCSILIEEMRKLEFKESNISSFLTNPKFESVYSEAPQVQRVMLTMLINNIFAMGPYIVPSNIRLALSISTDARGWSDDLKIVLLPFLKANEDLFFPL